RRELRRDRPRDLAVDPIAGDVAVLDRIGLQRVAQVARRKTNLLLDRTLAAEIARADEERLRAAKDGSREVVLAQVEEETVVRRRRLTDGDCVPDVESDRLDEDDVDAC